MGCAWCVVAILAAHHVVRMFPRRLYVAYGDHEGCGGPVDEVKLLYDCNIVNIYALRHLQWYYHFIHAARIMCGGRICRADPPRGPTMRPSAGAGVGGQRPPLRLLRHSYRWWSTTYMMDNSVRCVSDAPDICEWPYMWDARAECSQYYARASSYIYVNMPHFEINILFYF